MLLALLAAMPKGFAQTQVGIVNYNNEGVYYKLWSDGTASIESHSSHDNLSGTLTLHDTLHVNSHTYTLTRIGTGAFIDVGQQNLTGSLVIPSTVTSIGDNAFYRCGFNGTLTLPESITSIGFAAFCHCEFTGSLTLPPLLTVIEPLAFESCQFTGDLVIPDGVTSIGWNAFQGNKLSSVTIGDNVTTIGARAFWGTIDNIVLGHSVSSIGDNAFLYTGDVSLHPLYIECRISVPPTLGTDVFKYSSFPIGSIAVPCGATKAYVVAEDWPDLTIFYYNTSPDRNVCINGVYYQLVCEDLTAKVMNSAFSESSQGVSYSGKVVIPDTVEYEGFTYSVTQVAPYAFFACQSVTSVTFGSNMQSIGDYAFGWCTGLDLLIFQGDTPPTLDKFTLFAMAYQQKTAIVPCGASSAYQATDWRYVCNSIVEMRKIQVSDLFYEIPCDSGTTATVVYDASYATMEAASVEDFEYQGTPYTVIDIADNAFDGCAHLKSFDCHANLLSVGDFAFRNCDSLEYVGLYHTDTPPTVGEGAFDGLGIDTLWLMVPFCSQYEYAIHPVWGQFGEIFPDGNCEYNFIGMEDALWSNLANWRNANSEPCTALPGVGAQVGIQSDCEMDMDVAVGSITIGGYYDEEYGCFEHLTVKDGATLTATSFIYNSGDAQNFIIEDGAQVVHPNAGAQATVEKNIAAHTATGGWHFIASPLVGSLTPTADNGFLANEYDLYFYDEPAHYWRNHKQGTNNANPNFDIDPLKGYLYANSANDTLQLQGSLRAATETVNIPLSYASADGILIGFNLVGNPFAHNVTDFTRTNVADEVYQLNDLRNEVMVGSISTDNPLKPGEGFFVKATSDNASITFNDNGAKGSGRSLSLSKGRIALEISQDNLLIDRLILKRDGAPLEKFTLNENGTKVYATKDAQDWAVVVIASEAKQSSPIGQAVNFKAAKDGEYTLRVNMEGLDLDYLHLIDNLTGADVDLLPLCKGSQGDSNTQPTYTFTAKTTDYASRFKLVFSTNDASTGSASDAPFAYISDGNIIVNGKGTLQVIDMMGRVIVSHNGHTRCVSTAGMTAGVYVLRLIDGDSVRTQKIVIE